MPESKHLRIALNSLKTIDSKYRQLKLEYDPETRSVWTYVTPSGTACYNLGVLNEIKNNDLEFKRNHGKAICGGQSFPVDFFISASGIKHIFNYGGDLALFVQLIKSRDREALLHYAKLCIDCIFARVSNYETSAITISLVQGDALGGGFETALASNVVIAEEQIRMGFPEILFNLFPGMGAYSLVARRLGARKAEEIILGGKMYGAQELLEIGLIDRVVPKGEGESAVFEYMHQSKKNLNGIQSIYACRHYFNPITYQELLQITEMWVDAALRLTDKDLKMMGRIVRSQMRRQQELQSDAVINSQNMDFAAE